MLAHNRRRILVVNPNSNEVVTRGLEAALAAVAFQDGPEIICETLKEGPLGIESQAHVDSVAGPLRTLVGRRNDVDAFVIACYSDPGLAGCREATARPVFGINEAGVLTALARGERFGVIAIAQTSIRRHLRYLRQLGLTERLAGERALNMSVAETAADAGALARMIAVGKELTDHDGADVSSWAAPAWPGTEHRSPPRSGSASSTRPRPPSPWRSAPYSSPNPSGADPRATQHK